MMSEALPPLRPGLDIFPSPVADRPGLVLRDPFQYTEQVLIIPPLLAAGLALFDGEQTRLDLQAYLSKLAGQLVPRETIEALLSALQSNGFLLTEEFAQMRAVRHAEFAAATERSPAHAGTGYPDEPAELRQTFEGYLQKGLGATAQPIIGLAAPHVSPWGGADCYAAAYGRLQNGAAAYAKDKTIVLLGTSHYGQPERFGLTRKPFTTPFGTLQPDVEKIDWLAAQAKDSVMMEDYCHAVEHSLEFQCVFLQQMLGADFKILPILCGPFAKALREGEPPERDDQVYRFFDALGELADLHASELFWVLGIDLAHMGKRYGDELLARAEQGAMLEVKERDQARLQYACAGESEEFFELVKPDEDELKWCGFAPLYTFMQVQPQARGKVLRYDQWNIDEESVVSFAALEFSNGAAAGR
ncbi:MAG: AmmeMemoRadiSam system protein B [Acidobacteria bacterium]|nr:AmmeMemoRadiSam system protein B [Acidobacteriota bacterium]MBI3423938.1 AmmeMemoRadiSam system protein B [Acidobacteriota bacterium]